MMMMIIWDFHKSNKPHCSSHCPSKVRKPRLQGKNVMSKKNQVITGSVMVNSCRIIIHNATSNFIAQMEHSKMLWSSVSSFKGEVMDGNLHGIGTYTGADVYEGNWILNKKHGFGRKQYANGDVYEGLWKWDMPEGKRRYFWSNGSAYGGEWRNGLMCGIGVHMGGWR